MNPRAKTYDAGDDEPQDETRTAPRDTGDPDEEGDWSGPTPDLLPVYLRQMAATPLLTPEEEVRIARQLQEGREKYAGLILSLPAACRKEILQDDPDGPKQPCEWPIDQLDACHGRLLQYAAARGKTDHRLDAAVRDAKRLKVQVDRARDGLITANLRLVTHIVKKYSRHGMPSLDLIQEGNIGLMRAVEKFEWQRGYKFSTYAYWWIKQAITRAIADKSRLIRIPVHISEKLKKIHKATAELEAQLGREPTVPEIARKLRMPKKKLQEIFDILQGR